MPESPREPLSALHRRMFAIGLSLLIVAGLGATGCKKNPGDTIPAEEVTGAEPAQPANPDDGTRPDRDTRPRTEVEDNTFGSEGIGEQGVEKTQLTDDEVLSIVQEQLRTVFFGYDQSQLSETTRRVLETNAKILSLNPEVDVIVEGHCDERGTIEYNLALGQRRAESVRDYLIQLGVEADRLRTVSYGEERPVDTGGTESAWSRNRRAAFVVE